MILSAALMLRYLGEEEAGLRLENAVKAVITEGKSVTYDFKDNPSDSSAVGTSQMASAVIAHLSTS